MAESFFRRWSRRKAEQIGADGGAGDTTAASSGSSIGPASPAPSLPTLNDVAKLDPASDYSSFVASGVDKTVRRAALKKLFSDPHFNIMDGLDIYIDDYNKPSPVSAAMLAALRHAQTTLNPPSLFDSEEKTAEEQEPAGIQATETVAGDADIASAAADPATADAAENPQPLPSRPSMPPASPGASA